MSVIGNQSRLHFDIILFDLGSTLIYFNGNWQDVMEASVTTLFHPLQANDFALYNEQFIRSFNERLHACHIKRDREYFELILVSADVGIRKPNPRIFQMALDHFCVHPSRAVMVGDNLNAGILGARKSGVVSVWITKWASTPNYHIFEDAIVPDKSIAHLGELPDLISQWKTAQPGL